MKNAACLDDISFFCDEVLEEVEKVQKNILQLEKNFDQKDQRTEIIKLICRSWHNIKGSSGMFGLERIQRLSHRAEDIFVKSSDVNSTSCAYIISLSLQYADRVLQLTQALKEHGKEPVGKDEDLLEQKTTEISLNLPEKMSKTTDHFKNFLWDATMLIGDSRIDSLHKQIIDHLNQISKIFSEFKKRPNPENRLNLAMKISEHAGILYTHFEIEESIIHSNSLGQSQSWLDHQSSHQFEIHFVRELAKDILEEKVLFSQSFLKGLFMKFRRHIQEEDKSIFLAVENNK